MHALVVSRHLAIGLTVASNVVSLVGFFSGLLLLTALSDREIKTNVLSHPDRASSLFYVLLVMVLLAFSAWGVVWWLRRASAVVIRGKDTRGSGRHLRAMTTPSPMSASSAASTPESSPRCVAPSSPDPYAGDFAVANSPQGGGDMREDDVGGAVGFAEDAVDITAGGDGRAARVHRLTRGESSRENGKAGGGALTVQTPSPGPSPRPRRKARGGGLDVLRALFAAFFPVSTLVAFVLPSGIGNCVPGLPGYASGGFCECDPRTLKASSGVPAYMPGGEVPPNTTIAFVGDSGLRDTADEIYRLMRGEGVSAVVLNGDMDYKANPAGWIARFEAGMGKGMPLFTTVGNHDTRNWVDYQEATLNHWRHVNGSTTTMGMAVATGAGAGTGTGAGTGAGAGAGAGTRGSSECRGSVGVKEVCTHQGLGLLLSGAGSGCGGLQETHTAFFTETLDEFARNKVRWPLCIFHQNVKAMQLGSKGDVVGWDKYDACLKRGAMIITAHDHTYGRTHELDRFGSPAEVNILRKVPPYASLQEADKAMHVGPGKTFVVVAGTGGADGESLRSAKVARTADPWWSVTWSKARDRVKPEATQKLLKVGEAGGAGAFFCSFHVEGDPALARCYYKDVKGRLVDSFYVRSSNGD